MKEAPPVEVGKLAVNGILSDLPPGMKETQNGLIGTLEPWQKKSRQQGKSLITATAAESADHQQKDNTKKQRISITETMAIKPQLSMTMWAIVKDGK